MIVRNHLLKTLLFLLSPFLVGGLVTAQEITSFTLINAATDTDVGPLQEQDTIDLNITGNALNIRANATGPVGSVRFWLNGVQQNTEGVAPYAMVGDNSGDYLIWSPAPGPYTVKATPYSEGGASGTAGISLEVNFYVTKSVDPIVMPEDPGTGEVTITGELMKWHRVTLSFDGPAYRETDLNPNPFLDYDLEVTFSIGEKSYIVPGYFAADGNAAETGSDSGNIWRVHFAPDTTGLWNYSARFHLGRNVASGELSGELFPIPPMDGKTGSFEIQAGNKSGKDNRAKGRLNYVGEHYLQYAETGEYFVKGGADSPENFLAYADFDGEFKNDGRKDDLVKTWSGHMGDWHPGDPLWGGGKGKGIIGAVNYLASEGLDAFSFLTMNIEGDDRNVYPYISYTDYTHFDCSKLDQWEIVFKHADSLGMYLHFKTQETENDQLLDGGDLGVTRKLYYRELIARYGHHLALNWNLGEENSQTTAQRKAMAAYFREKDPYRHPVVIHTFPGQIDAVYSELVGNRSGLTGVSIQTGWANVHSATLTWVTNSADEGKKWVVANDEQGSAQIGVPDDGYTLTPDKDDIRKQVLWGNLMAGGGGVEYYFGYQRPHSDLYCEDFRSRDISWDYVRYALDFFRDHIPFKEMDPRDELTNTGWCLASEGRVYLLYLPAGGTATVQLTDTSYYRVQWFDPRNGGSLRTGSLSYIQGPGNTSVGTAPDNMDKDWAVLVNYYAEEPDTSTASHFPEAGDVMIYPNPAFSSVIIGGLEGIREIRLVTLQGQPVMRREIGKTETELSLIGLTKGMYLVIFTTGEGRQFCRKLIRD